MEEHNINRGEHAVVLFISSEVHTMFYIEYFTNNISNNLRWGEYIYEGGPIFVLFIFNSKLCTKFQAEYPFTIVVISNIINCVFKQSPIVPPASCGKN